MADDHYVAQAYLRNFSNSDGLLIPYYKKGEVVVGKPKSPRSVCYQPEGNTNTYFPDKRILEDYLTPLENRWNDNLVKLEMGQCDPVCRMEISSYLAFLRTCTPTAIRQSVYAIKGFIQSTTKVLAMNGRFYNENFSPEFNDEMIEGLLSDRFQIEVDKEYAHARNMGTLSKLPIALWSADWKVLITNQNSFLTSDNPYCLYYPKNNPMVNWGYVPLKPNMALLLRPRIDILNDIKKENTENIGVGGLEYGKVRPKYEFLFNENLVRHAEEKVFFPEKADWVERLVRKNREWKTVAKIDALFHSDGIANITRQRLSKEG